MKVIKWTLTRVTEGVLLSVGTGMVLYLWIAQVDLKGIPSRLFLCDYVMNEMHMLILYDSWSYMILTSLMNILLV